MSNVMNPMINVDAYGWRCAALTSSKMTAFEAFTHGVKRTPATATRAAVRAWNGPIT